MLYNNINYDTSNFLISHQNLSIYPSISAIECLVCTRYCIKFQEKADNLGMFPISRSSLSNRERTISKPVKKMTQIKKAMQRDWLKKTRWGQGVCTKEETASSPEYREEGRESITEVVMLDLSVQRGQGFLLLGKRQCDKRQEAGKGLALPQIWRSFWRINMKMLERKVIARDPI